MRRATKEERACVLLVEDDVGDQELIRRALVSERGDVDLRIVEDAERALDYLGTCDGAEGSCPRPGLVLLDLNLPGMRGHRFLERAKGWESPNPTPVVVLTTSSDERDVLESYRLGCNSYVVKPADARGFMSAVRDIYAYWFDLVKLPESEGRRLTGNKR